MGQERKTGTHDVVQLFKLLVNNAIDVEGVAAVAPNHNQARRRLKTATFYARQNSASPAKKVLYLLVRKTTPKAP